MRWMTLNALSAGGNATPCLQRHLRDSRELSGRVLGLQRG
jgi:hypothetical protein